MSTDIENLNRSLMALKDSLSVINTETKVYLARIDGKIDLIAERQATVTKWQANQEEWQEEHEIKEEDLFDTVFKRIDGLLRYAVSVAIISGFIGFMADSLFDFIFGK